MTDRRRFIAAIAGGALLAPLRTGGQPRTSSAAPRADKVWRIGFLYVTTPAYQAKYLQAITSGLRDLGYVEGKNLELEYRYAEGKAERLPELAAELVRLNVDVIVTAGDTSVIAASRATSTIPIVAATSTDLVALGLAQTLSKPGGNVTGSIFFLAELQVKKLELVKEALPGLTRVALLGPPENASAKIVLDAVVPAAKRLKVEVLPYFTVPGGTDFEAAFAAIAQQRVGAILIPDHTRMNSHAITMADLAIKHRIPAAGNLEFAEAGGLMGNGVDFVEMNRRAAVFVDKIFRGIMPGDIPIERATKFEIVVNTKTAKILGIEIPQALLLRADEVIQ